MPDLASCYGIDIGAAESTRVHHLSHRTQLRIRYRLFLQIRADGVMPCLRHATVSIFDLGFLLTLMQNAIHALYIFLFASDMATDSILLERVSVAFKTQNETVLKDF